MKIKMWMRVVKLLREKGSQGLTVSECKDILGTGELRKIVSDLKRRGYNIHGIWNSGFNKFGDSVIFKKYFLIQEQEVVRE